MGPVVRGIVDLVLRETRDIKPTETINAVVGETNDGWLNAIHQDVISKQDVQRAWENRSEDFELGCVGAGTGTRAFPWMGRIGTASRRVDTQGKTHTVGALALTHGMTVVTRNVADLAPTGVPVLNPWVDGG